MPGADGRGKRHFVKAEAENKAAVFTDFKNHFKRRYGIFL